MERRDETPREKKPVPQRQRLVLISGDGDDVERSDAGPLRIVGSEPRAQDGGFRLTDR